MLILIIRTDKPNAEIGLFENHAQIAYETWPAHRQLAATISRKIMDLFRQNNKALTDLEGIICFEGPGSFTGLRIGMSVGNAIAYDLIVPIVATGSEDWIARGIERLLKGDSDPLALPEYGTEARITRPKKSK